MRKLRPAGSRPQLRVLPRVKLPGPKSSPSSLSASKPCPLRNVNWRVQPSAAKNGRRNIPARTSSSKTFQLEHPATRLRLRHPGMASVADLKTWRQLECISSFDEPRNLLNAPAAPMSLLGPEHGALGRQLSLLCTASSLKEGRGFNFQRGQTLHTLLFRS